MAASSDTTASATTTNATTLTPAQRQAQVRSETIRRYGVYPLPVSERTITRYHLNKNVIRQIAKAKKFASTRKARSVRQCESGGNYRINTGNGYYGAYQFDKGTWLANGGGRYSKYAHQAPPFAQDHIMWKTWLVRGWQPWACA